VFIYFHLIKHVEFNHNFCVNILVVKLTYYLSVPPISVYIASAGVFGLWNVWIVTSEQVTYQKFPGRDWSERRPEEGTHNCLVPLHSFIRWSACWFCHQGQGSKTVEATINPTIDLWKFNVNFEISLSCILFLEFKLQVSSNNIYLYITIFCLEKGTQTAGRFWTTDQIYDKSHKEFFSEMLLIYCQYPYAQTNPTLQTNTQKYT
jgi:hypothetical protein